MGHGSSKSTKESSSSSSSGSGSGSRRKKLKDKLHLHRRRSRGNGSNSDPSLKLSADNFAGIALLTLIAGEMKFKDKWLACVSVGEQTFRTDISDHTDKPIWNSEKKFLLERNGPHIARISVYETNRMVKNNIIGYCEVDLLEFLTRDSDSDSDRFELLDPSSNVNVGNISLSCSVEDPMETQKNFARRILSIVDYNEDGKLSFSEFSDLINAFGNQLAANKKEELFKAADKNGDGVVSMDELAALLASQQEKEPLMNCCPVCGEVLEVSDRLNAVIHMTLCFDEGTGNQVMTGGFLTDKEASYGWFFKLSEWAHVSSYDVGLNSGSSASHILVFDRRTKRIVEELIDGKIVLSMRAIYQSKVGLSLMDKGAKEILQSISEKQGRKMNSVESAKDIPKFVEFFKDQMKLAEVKYPLEHFKSFNEFFIRELKPGVRPIACMERDDVAVCAADCRLMAFNSIGDSLRLWIKGRKFSIQGLLGKELCSSAFLDGTLVIFRLAPQDYHRFHFPVSGTIEQFAEIPGCLYTVNPIAVNSKYCNVFTENKRVVSIISTADFGKVAFVAIGATMVGSITFTKKKGAFVKKGDEFGYFSFGGSTVICVFEKDSIQIDEDLLKNSGRSLETLVSVGMTLGVATKKLAGNQLPNLENCVLGA
ncbi:C2 domain-containing protein/PS_Dcarbxylase domain-containing protein/EF_hand_5 domain-containing protein [Cephalotus follicularis]|uniref:Phosphatidylserine decarboxylase proenzyme 2 n=1 Tax=Cephalotus follicularis TaxID=3775 RepID=A0A1Q3CLL6_CEPFO|nr:C2 domain-containing protein/PS_Dcarbxylase domain-containing protein/EF_hand_5 domain-containing protein [Cephalotus follicularis]